MKRSYSKIMSDAPVDAPLPGAGARTRRRRA
jgi:hypothetical protein